ncbi:hypothetical protein X975_06914, partial [Stegodyphus mimosarum]
MGKTTESPCNLLVYLNLNQTINVQLFFTACLLVGWLLDGKNFKAVHKCWEGIAIKQLATFHDIITSSNSVLSE